MVLSAFAPRLREMELGLVKGKLDTAEESAGLMAGLMAGQEDPGTEPLEKDELVVMARTALARDALAMLLEPPTEGALVGCRLRLYLLDEEERLLVPLFTETRHRRIPPNSSVRATEQQGQPS